MNGATAVRAILINLVGILLLDLMGVIIKLLSGDYRPSELSAYRNMFGMAPSLIVLVMSADWHAQGRKLRLRQWPLAWLRGGFVAAAQFMFYLSLARMEFATASTRPCTDSEPSETRLSSIAVRGS